MHIRFIRTLPWKNVKLTEAWKLSHNYCDIAASARHTQHRRWEKLTYSKRYKTWTTSPNCIHSDSPRSDWPAKSTIISLGNRLCGQKFVIWITGKNCRREAIGQADDLTRTRRPRRSGLGRTFVGDFGFKWNLLQIVRSVTTANSFHSLRADVFSPIGFSKSITIKTRLCEHVDLHGPVYSLQILR